MCRRLGLLGIAPPAREHVDDDMVVSAPDAAVPVLVIRPREELQLAREALAVLALIR